LDWAWAEGAWALIKVHPRKKRKDNKRMNNSPYGIFLAQWFLSKDCAIKKQPGSLGGVLRAELEKKGTPIGAMNFQIAATALLYTATLVTNNVREFSKVEGLVWEAWVV
jgi:tRNA(fMet)-specific endonuclease VapC